MSVLQGLNDGVNDDQDPGGELQETGEEKQDKDKEVEEEEEEEVIADPPKDDYGLDKQNQDSAGL